MKSNKPAIYSFDLETFPNLGYVWGKWEQNLLAYKQHGYLMSLAYKQLGHPKVECLALPDYEATYKLDPVDDGALTKTLWHLFDKADVLIGHNGKQFDAKKSYSAFLKHNLPPPRPVKIVDTKIVSKAVLRQDSNSLDDLGEFFGLGRKKRTGGIDLWLDCGEGNMAAWRKMKAYNKQDVVLLEKVYLKLLPFMTGHPNYNLLIGEQMDRLCPNCGSPNIQRRGYEMTRVTRFARFQCQDCGAWGKKPMNKTEKEKEARKVMR